MPELVAILAVAVPALQVAAMGLIAYPIAVRRPGGMERFHRSGFSWWLITLTAVLLVAVASDPGLLEPSAPASNEVSSLAVIAVGAAAAAVIVALELAGDAWIIQRGGAAAQRGRERYESALPTWATGAWTEPALLGLTALLEEAVFRAVALGALIGAWSLGTTAAAVIVSAAFGISHWYYGTWQIAMKTLAGGVLCVAALEVGWIAAAVGHVGANLILVAIARRAAA